MNNNGTSSQRNTEVQYDLMKYSYEYKYEKYIDRYHVSADRRLDNGQTLLPCVGKG